jgi:hypothetical protein
VGFSVLLKAEGRSHVDDSFDEFCFVNMGGGGIAALKLWARQAIATFQRRQRSSRTHRRVWQRLDHELTIGFSSGSEYCPL